MLIKAGTKGMIRILTIVCNALISEFGVVVIKSIRAESRDYALGKYNENENGSFS